MTDARLRLLYKFAILLALTVLAIVIGLGEVKAETSYGLKEIITGLLILAGAESIGSHRK